MVWQTATTHQFIQYCFVLRSWCARMHTDSAGIRSSRTRHKWHVFSPPSHLFPDSEFVLEAWRGLVGHPRWPELQKLESLRVILLRRVLSSPVFYISFEDVGDGGSDAFFSKWLIICCPHRPIPRCRCCCCRRQNGFCCVVAVGFTGLQRLTSDCVGFWQGRRCLWVV